MESSSSSTEYNGVSFSIGAARGFYLLGALHAAEINDKLKQVTYFAGTSIGAAIALLVAVGWTGLEVFTHLCTDDISKYVSMDLDVQTILTKWGMMNTEKMKVYLTRMIVSKWGGVPTFADLHKQGKVFICCAYRLKSINPCVYFSHKSHASMSTLDAVMLSMNLPFMFEGRQYEGSYYIDGGLFDKNPAKYLETFMLDEEVQPKILALSLGSREASELTEQVASFKEYIQEVLFVSMYQQRRIESSNTIDSLYLQTINSNSLPSLIISNKTKIDWFCSGLNQGLNYFTTPQEEHTP